MPEHELVHPDNEGFAEKVTPKSPENLFFFKCKKVKRSKECGSIHYRHAGYLKTMLPYLKPGGEKRVCVDNVQVMVCVSCRACYVWVDDQMYDVTDQIDLKAWEKLEKEADKATGPGGEC